MHDSDSSEHMRMAYMDNELPEQERAAYDKGLTEEQRQAIALDKALQHGIVDHVERTGRCPDELWHRARLGIGGAKQQLRTRRLFKFSAAAACLILGLGLFYVSYAFSDPIEVQVSLPEDVVSFGQGVTITGDQGAIEDVLHDQGFDVGIGDIATCNRNHRHRVALLGMTMMKVGDKETPCAQLRFSCCRRPVTAYVVKASPRITKDSFKAVEPSKQVHRMSHTMNGYLIVTMSYHPVKAVGSLFDTALPNSN